jgi:hypothetical protein
MRALNLVQIAVELELASQSPVRLSECFWVEFNPFDAQEEYEAEQEEAEFRQCVHHS